MSWTQVTEEDGSTTINVEPTAVGASVVEIELNEPVKPKKLKAIKPKVSILEEAQTIIYGDREKTYGHPAKNLKTIANMWNAYMNNMDDGNFTITAKDVAAMMMLVKVARFANDPSHRDNLVDVCGYAALIERCDEVK